MAAPKGLPRWPKFHTAIAVSRNAALGNSIDPSPIGEAMCATVLGSSIGCQPAGVLSAAVRPGTEATASAKVASSALEYVHEWHQTEIKFHLT